MRSIPHQRGLACMALGIILALYAAAVFAEDPTVEQLQQEMKAMKAQFDQMQQKRDRMVNALREIVVGDVVQMRLRRHLRRPPPRRRRRARSNSSRT